MALPGLIVEVALETGPNDTPGGGDWTDLSDRVLAFSMKRGRDDRTATFDPGTVSLSLDNSDDELDPWRIGSMVEAASDKGLPLCPIRIQVTHNAVDYPVFYGYIGPECWIVERSRVDGVSTVRLDAVDRMGLFTQTRLPSSLFAAQLQWLRPDWWVRGIGGDVASGNGDALRDSSGNGVVGEIAASGSDVIFETASLVSGDSDSAMLHQAGVAGFTDDATLIASRANMTMACVWRGEPDAADQEIMRQRNMTSGFVRWRVECQTSGQIVATIYDTGGSATDFVSAPANPDGGRWDDEQPHIIFCRIEGGTRMRVWVDGQRDECVASIPATIAGRVIFGGGSEVAAFDEVAYWDSALPTLDINSITDAFMGTAPFSGDTMEERIERWWALTDRPQGGSDLEAHLNDSGPETAPMGGVSDMPSTLAEALDQVAESVRGAAWCTREGAIRVRTYLALFDNPNHLTNYVTPIANLTDLATPASSPPPVRRSRPELTGSRLDRLVNVSRVTWEGLSFSLRNDDSIARYGERVREWTSNLEAVYDATILADLEVNGGIQPDYASPTFEMNGLVVHPLIDENAADLVFEELELERMVTVEWTNPAGVVSRTSLNIQSESWSWAGSDLSVTLVLASAGWAPSIQRPYISDVMVDEPIAYWPLGSGSTTEPDWSGNGRDGTWTATPTSSGLIPYQFGGVSLVGDKSCSVPYGAWRQDTRSVEAWVAFTSSSTVCIISDRETDERWGLYHGLNGNYVQFNAATGIHTTSIAEGSTINDGDLHHVVGTIDGTDIRIYVDGVLCDTVACAYTPLTTPQDMWLASESATRRFDGRIAHLALYDQVLTAGRVLAHYAAGTE